MWIGWGVLLCLLEVGASSEVITQQPSLVLQENQPAQLECYPIKGHNAMYWYRQDAGQGPQLLFFFQNKESIDTGKTLPRFTAEWPQSGSCKLKISSVKPEDSSVYLCASSLGTALQSHLLFLQKPQCV
uniref:Uncharacterized protein n=1 Tax=Sphaerodactylus townsendi TaxID=933632 RepID=A0ACB8ESB4_9SAUR